MNDEHVCHFCFYPSRGTLNYHAYSFFFILQGYLRAGKALLLAEKPEKALDVYAYGLKTLGEQHPQKEVRTIPLSCLVSDLLLLLLSQKSPWRPSYGSRALPSRLPSDYCRHEISADSIIGGSEGARQTRSQNVITIPRSHFFSQQ